MKQSLLITRIDALIRFFLYVLIFWLPYSPAVVESCVVTCLILWLIKHGIILSTQTKSDGTLKNKVFEAVKAFRLESTFLNVPILFFVSACLLSVTSSAFFSLSLPNFLTKTLEWFVIYFLVVEVIKEKKHVYIVLGILVFTAFSTVIDSFIQFYITNKDIFLGHEIEPGSRATAGFKTPNGLGGYLTVIIPGLSAWVLLGKQKYHLRLIALLILIFSFWSLTITFSRGAWIGTFFGGMFLLFFALFPEKRLNIYFSLGLLWATISLFILFFIFLADSSGQEYFRRDYTIYWRMDLWSECIEMIKDKFLFGHGVNTFMNIFQTYRKNVHLGPTYAHNCYLQLAVETGIVGLLSFFWIIAKAFHRSLGHIQLSIAQDRNLEVLIVALLSGIFAFLVHSFLDTHFYSLQLSVYLWFMMGVLVATCKVSDETAAADPSILEINKG